VEKTRHPVHDAIVELLGPLQGEVVVDLGTGLGATLAAVRQACPGVRRIGLDFDASRLGEIRAADDSVLLARADLARPLPLAAASVDILACHNVFELLADPSVVLTEAARTLRPGGRALWGHTDFARLVIEGADPRLTRRVLAAYSTVPAATSPLAPDAAGDLADLVAGSPLTVDTVTTHEVSATSLESPWTRRVAEVATVTLRLVDTDTVDLTLDQLQTWWEQLVAADAAGRFRFVESAVLVLSHRNRH
jgi:SAM-dependent methyltransferase